MTCVPVVKFNSEIPRLVHAHAATGGARIYSLSGDIARSRRSCVSPFEAAVARIFAATSARRRRGCAASTTTMEKASPSLAGDGLIDRFQGRIPDHRVHPATSTYNRMFLCENHRIRGRYTSRRRFSNFIGWLPLATLTPHSELSGQPRKNAAYNPYIVMRSPTHLDKHT